MPKHRPSQFINTLLTAVLISTPAYAANVNITWLGGTGSWNAPSNWDLNTIPNNAADSFNVFIDASNPSNSVVNLNSPYSINALAIDSGDALNVTSSVITLVADTMTNAGIFTLNNSTLQATAFNQTFLGPGKIMMQGTSKITNEALTITAAQSIISNGVGTIASTFLLQGGSSIVCQSGSLSVASGTNLGSVSCQSGSLILGTVYNYGPILAKNTASIEIKGYTYNYTGGLITADGAGSSVMLDYLVENDGGQINAINGGKVTFSAKNGDSLLIQGGPINVSNGGILTLGASANFQNVTMSVLANSVINGVDYFDLSGSVVVDGKISLAGVAKLFAEGGTLSGNGTLAGNLINQAAVLSPGRGSGFFTVTSYEQDSTATLLINLAETGSPAIAYDQLVVTSGPVTIAGTLSLSLLSSFNLGDKLTILDNQSPNPIAGTFSNLPEGSKITTTFNGLPEVFIISYRGGTGNDITLTALPEPASLSLLALAALPLLKRRRA